ncbi:MAG: hypothetical protein ABW277_23290 [Longimicrobiaceae bacterium]
MLGGLLAGALALGGTRALDRFEYVAFTPPAGWLVAHAEGGRQYVLDDPGGAGLVRLLPSEPTPRAADQVFADLWRVHATQVIAGPAPRPAIRREGDATLAIGSRQVASQGTTARVVVAAVLWRGRALGIVGMANGARRQAELDAFFGTLRPEPGPPAAAAPAPTGAQRPAGAPAGGLGFDVPPGYVQQRNGDVVILAPVVVGERTPCIYGIAAPRAATGNLEADAEAALLQSVVAGWRRLDDWHYAMRGTSAAGWPYVWYRAAFEGEVGGQRQAVNAMAMVLPAGPGRVHVVWGMGSIARCLLDDASFEQLFHSLRPAGWTPDGGQALMRGLVGTWRYTASGGLQQLTFRTDGRYDRDLGSRASVGVMERTSTTASGGRFTLRDGMLTLAPDQRPQAPDRYHVRLYDEWLPGNRVWKRAIALVDGATSPPLVIPYYRVDEDSR